MRIRPDGLLLQCSYTFGVIDARRAGADAAIWRRSLRHIIPGDERRPGCMHLAWDGDVVYTVHRGNIRNPAFRDGAGHQQAQKLNPVQLPVASGTGRQLRGH